MKLPTGSQVSFSYTNFRDAYGFVFGRDGAGGAVA
jgi:hypothetical protein